MTTSPHPPQAVLLPSVSPATRMVIALLMTVTLGACASSGAGRSPQRTALEGSDITRTESGDTDMAIYSRPDGTERTVGAGIDFVWAVMPAVYAQLEIPLALSDPRIKELGNRGYRARRIEGDRLSKFFRCGQSMTGSRTNEYEITLSVVTILTEAPDGNTFMKTTVDARGRQRATNAIPVNCETTGALEERLAEVARKLVAEKISGRM